MSNIYRTSLLLLVICFTACTSNLSNMHVANGEDEDVGLGGTGVLAQAENSSGDKGLGGTGILGEITGFGSIFVNGIEIEYGNETTFTVDGKASVHQRLEIGDVVEVLTTDSNQHTHARVINLRHEVIGKVESIDPQTYSFTVQGQTIIQPVDIRLLPAVGTTVAISGFRIDKTTIISTRVVPVNSKEVLLRRQTELPFKGDVTHWLLQMHVPDSKAVFMLDDATHVINVKAKAEKSYADHLGIRILQLRESKNGNLKLDQIIESVDMPRGQRASAPVQWRGSNQLLKPILEAVPGAGQGLNNVNVQPKNRGKR